MARARELRAVSRWMNEQTPHADFDALSGADSPAGDLGPLCTGRDAEEAVRELLEHASAVVTRVQESFGTEVGCDSSTARLLDDLVSAMWQEGWSPESGNIRLFTKDFGSVLAVAMSRLPGATLVFRTSRPVYDTSVWFQDKRIEFFPFHKVGKSLATPLGESIAQFYRAATRG